MATTFQVGTLFDHFCAKLHVGAGLDRDASMRLRQAMFAAIRASERATLVDAFRDGGQLFGRSLREAPETDGRRAVGRVGRTAGRGARCRGRAARSRRGALDRSGRLARGRTAEPAGWRVPAHVAGALRATLERGPIFGTMTRNTKAPPSPRASLPSQSKKKSATSRTGAAGSKKPAAANRRKAGGSKAASKADATKKAKVGRTGKPSAPRRAPGRVESLAPSAGAGGSREGRRAGESLG